MSILTAPGSPAVAITPSDSVNFDECRGVYVGVAGDITGIVSGTAVLFKNAVAGSTISVRFTRINSTGTTATDLVALY